MYFLHRFSPGSTAVQQPIDSSCPQTSSSSALNNSTNRLRQGRKGRFNRHPVLTLPSKKASPTVCLSNAVVSAECIQGGGLSSLELLLPSPSGLPEPTLSSVPFPSSAPISLSCPLKYDDELSSDFRTCSFSEPSSTGDSWPTDLRRKRAKSCLASTYVHHDAHDYDPLLVTSDQCGSLSGYGSDTEVGFPMPTRRRRLAHSLKRGYHKKALKRRAEHGRGAGSIDVQFVATMQRSIAWHLSHAQEYRRTRTCSGMSTSDAYDGIAVDADINMTATDDISVVLGQDALLVDRLSRILGEQGFQSNRDKLSPPHELMIGTELRSPTLRLPALSPPPSIPLPMPPSGSLQPDSLDREIQFAEGDHMDTDCFSLPTTSPSSGEIRDRKSYEHVGLFSCSAVSSVSPSEDLQHPPSTTSSVTSPRTPRRVSHKRRHSQNEVILDMSQLVAALHLRFRDRAATRPRSRPSKATDAEVCHHPRATSPLSRMAFVARAECDLQLDAACVVLTPLARL